MRTETSVAEPSNLNYWAPWRRDPVLLQERKGRWRWPWALLLTILSIVIMVMVIGVGMALLIPLSIVTGSEFEVSQAAQATTNSLFTPGEPYSFLIVFWTYAAMVVGVAAAFSIRARSFRVGLTYNTPLTFAPFWKAGGAMLVMLALSVVLQYSIFPEGFAARSISPTHALWMLAAAMLLLVQTLGEELLFRGFLLRVWGAVVPIRLIAVTAISGTFISLHIGNPDIQADIYFSLIIFAALEVLYYWVLFRTRSVMATWGMHWINNVFAFLIVAQLPGWDNKISFITYTDPVLSGGGSYATNPWPYIVTVLFMLIFVLLVAWSRSPFYMAPVSVAPAHPQPTEMVQTSALDNWPPWFPKPVPAERTGAP
ncbi:MAG: CPBP family intramembrane glutamic endopeptidase [Hyphomicrobiales bacterium]|nr:CPBP family intramembrane glutamic endopeptidase [Hyphomicrobiales bacterium]